jgi:NitT/TauT family transport system permease protein
MASTPSRVSFALRALPGIASTAILLALWQIASIANASNLILPPPALVISEFASLLGSKAFYAALAGTASRGLLAFAVSIAAGGIAGVAAGLVPAIRSALRPLLAAIRSTPVLALILLLLIWFPQDAVPVVSAFLMAFPVFLSAVVEGIASADAATLEMAAVFKMRKRDVFKSVRLPSLIPFLVSGASGCLSLIWKVVIAGEVLSLPKRAIGTGLHDAKIYLDTPKAFAWAFSAILLCALTDIAFSFLTRRLRRDA